MGRERRSGADLPRAGPLHQGRQIDVESPKPPVEMLINVLLPDVYSATTASAMGGHRSEVPSLAFSAPRLDPHMTELEKAAAGLLYHANYDPDVAFEKRLCRQAHPA